MTDRRHTRLKTTCSTVLIDDLASHSLDCPLDNAHGISGSFARNFDQTITEPISIRQPDERSASLQPSSRILLRDGEQCHWIRLQDVVYFESCANHTLVCWDTKKVFMHNSIGKIETRLPDVFFRISRQHIVNIECVKSVELWLNGGYRLNLTIGKHVEVSRRHAKRFKESFSL